MDYGVVIAKNVMVPMRDGVRLATDVYRPAIDGEPAAGAFPTILGRTSYDKNTPAMWVEPVAEFFVPRGYVVVLQDLRGRHASEGTGQYFHTANPNEGEDGFDTIEWIASQPWSNGRVGMTGSSHGGIVQTAATHERPPHLTTIWVDVAPTNVYAHEAREGGAMALHMFGAMYLHAHDAQEVRDNAEARRELFAEMEDLRSMVYATPFKRGQTALRHVPNLEDVLFHYYCDGDYNDFWDQPVCNQAAHFDSAGDIPGVFSGGWYDPFPMATTGQYVAMANKNSTPQRLLMGPWNHGGMRGRGTTVMGDVDLGPSALFGDAVYNRERLRWFDRWLKGIDNGVDEGPPVRIFVMGGGTGRRTAAGNLDHGGQWRDENEWPPARAEQTAYYLHASGSLSPEPPREECGSLSFAFDPAHPVPTIAGAVTGFYELAPMPEGMNSEHLTPRARMKQIVLEGGAHQRAEPGMVGAEPPYLPLATRPDVLVFQTDPLDSDVEVTGPTSVTLYVSSSAPDTDFTAKLIDVYPPNEDYPGGYHLNLCDSILRVRYLDSWTRPQRMKPGEVYRIRIGLPPTSNLFKAGHLIRLDVSSSNFPRFDLNPNTGDPMGRHTMTQTAHNTVHTSQNTPSSVVLSIVPPRD